MLREELFSKVINSETIKRTEWVVKAFSIFKENLDEWVNDPYLYRIVLQPDGWYFVNEEKKLEKIDNAPLGRPIYKALEPYTLKPNEIPNVKEEIVSSYGTILVNVICLTLWFGDIIPFINGKIKPSTLSSEVLSRLEDDPDTIYDRKPGVIYVSDYLKFCDACFNLVAYTQVFTPGATEVSMAPPPDIKELRAILVEENKDRLHDPAVISDIIKQLQEYDLEWVKNDPSMGFMVIGKSLKIVRQKLFLTYGAEKGIDDGVDVSFIERSLSEGWDISKFPEMNNAQRAGSYNRGKQTELGGTKVKEIYRASGNFKIDVEDCKSQLGILYNANYGNSEQLIGFTAINGKEQELITKENVGKYLGKVVKLRSPMYCKATGTSYCKVCCGKRLSINPNGLPLEFSDYGSKFLGMFMSAAHAKALTVKRIDFDRLLY